MSEFVCIFVWGLWKDVIQYRWHCWQIVCKCSKLSLIKSMIFLFSFIDCSSLFSQLQVKEEQSQVLKDLFGRFETERQLAFWPQLCNLWWIANSVSKGFDTAMRTGSSRWFKGCITTYVWVSSRAYRKAGYLTMVIAGYIPANSQLAAATATIVKSLSIGK